MTLLNPNQKLSSAIVAILGVHSTGVYAQQASAASAANSDSIQEIVVTAQRRTESIQDVPITVQALTGDTLKQLNVSTLDDFIKALPNVTQSSTGPGQSAVFIRGLSIDAGFGRGGGTTGSLPAVAIYLDEQSGQLPGRNLDVYAADLERVEVLEGPQGTLFGGGALTGVLRYITNKPKLDVTEGSVDAGYGVTAHGDPNTNITAVINLPLIPDTLAVRAVVFNDRHGGYINNLPSTFTRLGTDVGAQGYNNGVIPTNSAVINNNNLVGNAINPLTYTGARAEILWKINDSWNALLSQSYQNMESQGVFYEMPYGAEGTTYTPGTKTPIGKYPLPPLSVNLFNPAYNNDKFENTALVINGSFADWKAVYSGSYLVRNVEQQQDYTSYARGVNGFYYQCAGYSSTDASKGQCYTPSTVYTEQLRNTHQSQELRMSSPDSFFIRGTAGVYWEDYDIVDKSFWHYVTVPTCSPTGLNNNCYLPIQPWPGSPSFSPTPAIGFFDDTERTYKQLAEFASIDVDIIPKVLTLTGGVRHFKYDEFESGGDVGSFYCKVGGPYGPPGPTTYFGPCKAPYGTNFTGANEYRASASGLRKRGNLSWHITPDILVYVTYSDGFRAGAFNRSVGCHLPDANGINQYCTPAVTQPDNVKNKEIGWKTEWWDHRIQFNGSVYQEDALNVQTGFFDPQGGLGNLAFSTNGPTYRIRGLEPSVIARVTSGLTAQVAASWNSSTQTNSPYLVDNNPQSPNFGKPLTQFPNPYGPLGSPTSYSPPFKIFTRLRYDWSFNDYRAFVQATGNHQTHMVTATGYVVAYDIPGFTSYDASAGIAKDAWTTQVFVQNLTNVNASTSTDGGLFVEARYPIRPRVIGVNFSYKFGGT